MKQKDILLVVVIGFVSAMASLVLSNFLFGAKSHKLTAETVDAITSTFNVPDSQHFNPNAVDPTKTIKIGDSSNNTPFR